MNKQKGIGLIEVIISSLILALVVAGCLKVIIDANQVQRDNNERTIALYKLSSVLEVHRHNPTLVDAFTPIFLSPSASVAEWVITDQTIVLPEVVHEGVLRHQGRDADQEAQGNQEGDGRHREAGARQL